ncbi:calponin homology domain-containing protein [Mycobacteroides abscessus]|uniref:hypothetical protein n=1 Tax=Mycobacteroides abscessus TaxID=36809 RepID=UPI0009A6D952|nr:hypothetical protein [Mycobacteroides abscessus]MDO3335127.1 hypothetical protein [Mycobacteroides abscessus subsp. bolletii]QSM87834.1 hypothetical protein I3U44_18740 [Mycobacteroides abscessus subsp. bolletii]
MTISHETGTEDIHTLVLKLLGAFAHLQDFVDNAIAKMFFDKRMPHTADLVWRRAVSRINDAERIELFLNIAEDIGTDADLSSTKDIYMGIKAVRDRVAHSATFRLDADGRLIMSKSVLSTFSKPIPAPMEVSLVQISNALWECRWLEAQMLYVALHNQQGIRVSQGPVVQTTRKPAATPAEWDGIVFQSG